MIPLRRNRADRRRSAVPLLSLLTVAALLTACADVATEPEVPTVSAKTNMICVQRNSDGVTVSTRPVNEHGSCANGFDLHIWM